MLMVARKIVKSTTPHYVFSMNVEDLYKVRQTTTTTPPPNTTSTTAATTTTTTTTGAAAAAWIAGTAKSTCGF